MFDSIDTNRFQGVLVGIAAGGVSPEREISLATGAAFEKALKSKGYLVQVYDVATDLLRLAADRPGVVLLGVHGGMGENGVLQGFLESLQIPYTGSGVLASALAMDKKRAKILSAQAGVAVARDLRFTKADFEDLELLKEEIELHFSYPLVAKLNDSGSSHGVYLVHSSEELLESLPALEGDLVDRASSAVIIEEFLQGPEYSVGFFERHCLGTMEIIPGVEFYDFAAKYERQDTKYEPVRDPLISAPLESMAARALDALGCRGVARVDFKGDPRGDAPWGMLEVNTIPGMTATSLVPKLARQGGVSFEDFVEAMLVSARTDEV